MKKILPLLLIIAFSMTSCRMAGTSVNSGLEQEGKILDSVEDVLVIGYFVKKRQYDYGRKDKRGKYYEEYSVTTPLKASQKEIQPFVNILEKHFRRIHVSPALLPQLERTYTDLDKECHPLMVSNKNEMRITVNPFILADLFIKHENDREYFHKFSKHIIAQEKTLGKQYDAYFYVTFEIDQRTFISEMNFIDLVGEKGNQLYYNEIVHNLDTSIMPAESPRQKNKLKPSKAEYNEWLVKILQMQAQKLEKDLAAYQSSNKAAQGLEETDDLLGL